MDWDDVKARYTKPDSMGWLSALSIDPAGVHESWLIGSSGRWGLYHYFDAELLVCGFRDKRTMSEFHILMRDHMRCAYDEWRE